MLRTGFSRNLLATESHEVRPKMMHNNRMGESSLMVANTRRKKRVSALGAGMTTALAMTLLLFGAHGTPVQQVGQNAPIETNSTMVIKANTQLVVETVVVKDKSGKFIEGLTAKDFTVTENGVSQTVSFCEHQQLPVGPAAAPTTPRQPENITVYDRLGRTHISTETPGTFRYQDRRLLALYFDMTAMPPEDQLRALGAAEKFIRTQMTTADRVAILRYEGAVVDVLQDFTDDRNRLLSIIETMIVGEGQGFGESVR